MKKLYKKGKVHPSPPLISDHLAFLPATILCLTVALSPEDKEVLAYLISCSGGTTTTSSSSSSSSSSSASFNGGNNKKNTQTQNQKSMINGMGSSSTEHPPLFHCDCFRCYTSFWVRWDSSPNRQLIHEIIDAFEDELSEKKKKMKSKKEKKKKGSSGNNGNGFVLDEMKRFEEIGNRVDEMGVIESVVINEEIGEGDDEEEEEEMDLGEKGSMRRFMSFVGERIWGVWGQ